MCKVQTIDDYVVVVDAPTRGDHDDHRDGVRPVHDSDGSRMKAFAADAPACVVDRPSRPAGVLGESQGAASPFDRASHPHGRVEENDPP